MNVEPKKCPRCGVMFECSPHKIHLCQCMTVELTKDDLQHISEQYQECLCASCLKALKDERAEQNEACG